MSEWGFFFNIAYIVSLFECLVYKFTLNFLSFNPQSME